MENKEMVKQKKVSYPLIEHLLTLVNEGEKDRGALAELRQGLQNPLRAARHVAPYLRYKLLAQHEEIYYLTAALFALHQQHEENKSFGRAVGELCIAKEMPTVETKLLALVSSRQQDVAVKLRGMVQLLASKEIGFDWHLFLRDLLYWNGYDQFGRDKPTQRRWLYDFYRVTIQTDNEIEKMEENKNEN